MTRYLLFATLFWISFPLGTANAQLAEFLTSISDQESAEIRLRNEYVVQKHLYFAKRHRIVRVNGDLLNSEGPFSISLFGHDALIVSTTDVKKRNNGAVLSWKGRLENQPIAVEDVSQLVGQGFTVNQAEQMLWNMFTIHVSAVKQVFDERSRKSQRFDKYQNDFSREMQESSPPPDIYFQAVAEISLPTLAHRYELRPIDTDPRYHLLMEIDSEKLFSEGPYDDPSNPEEALKRRQYRDFVDSLGEDPRRNPNGQDD